jgi:hypothetical protein
MMGISGSFINDQASVVNKDRGTKTCRGLSIERTNTPATSKLPAARRAICSLLRWSISHTPLPTFPKPNSPTLIGSKGFPSACA